MDLTGQFRGHIIALIGFIINNDPEVVI